MPTQKPANDIMDLGVLTERQRLFVEHMASGKMHKTAAARAAGYSHPRRNCVRLLAMPHIRKAIADAHAANAAASDMTRKKVVDGFVEAIDIARIKADPMAMVSGWREIGRMCGFYEPTTSRVEVSVKGQMLIKQMSTMSDDELLAMLQSEAEPIEGEFEAIEHDDEDQLDDGESTDDTDSPGSDEEE